MSGLPRTPFGSLLRNYRTSAGLTQEELAERAHLSVQAIGALERGDRRGPRKETIQLLAEALSLAGSEREAFEAAARQHRQADRTMFGGDREVDIVSTRPASADAAPPVVAFDHADTPTRLGPYTWAWGISGHEVWRAVVALVRGKPSIKAASVLMVALLGSALLLKGDLGTGLLAGSCGGTLALATDFPTTGIDGSPQGANDKSLENAVNLAVMQQRNLGSGYTLRAINYDDALPGMGTWAGIHDPTTGAHNIQQVVKNPCILGMVGPAHSDVAAVEMPIAANAGLAMISPGNTSPALTLRPYAEFQGRELVTYYGDQYAWVRGLSFDQLHPPGKPNNYFRDVPNDAAQVIADAHVTFDLGAKNVYVVNDPVPYGEVLAGGFTQAFEGLGGSVVGIGRIGPNAQGVLEVAARIAAAAPDAVFYGGFTSSGGGVLKGQLVQLGYKGFFVGADGIANDPDFVLQAGSDAANGTFASVGGRDPSTYTTGAAAQFLSDYAARYPGQAVSFNAAYAYDAAMVLITAIKHLIISGQAVTRGAILEQIQHVQYAGVTGPVSFDTNGDVTDSVFSIYTVHDGKWVYAWQVNV